MLLLGPRINPHQMRVMNAVCHLEADYRTCHYDAEILMPED